MKTANLVLAVLAAAALTACETTKPVYTFNPFATPNKCTVQDCPAVKVSIQPGADACQIAAIGDIDLREGPELRKITWMIETAGYEFSDENWKYGIYIENAPPAAFKNAQVTGEGKRTLTIMFNKADAPPKIKYTLTVRNSASKAFCDKLDPWFIV